MMDQWNHLIFLVTNVGLGAAMCVVMVRFTNNLTNHLITVTLPRMEQTFADQLEKERQASERRHEASLSKFDRLEEAQQRRHAENRQDAKEMRHMIRGLDSSVATFMAAVGEHLGVLVKRKEEGD